MNKIIQWLKDGENVRWYHFWDPRSGGVGGLIMAGILLTIIVLFS